MEAGVHWAELNGNGDRHLCSISMSQKDTKNEVAEEFDCTWEMWIAETRGKKRGQKKRVRERETELTRVAWKLSLKSNFSFTLSGFFFKDLNIFAAVAADGQAQFLPSFLTHSLPPSLPHSLFASQLQNARRGAPHPYLQNQIPLRTTYDASLCRPPCQELPCPVLGSTSLIVCPIFNSLRACHHQCPCTVAPHPAPLRM